MKKIFIAIFFILLITPTIMAQNNSIKLEIKLKHNDQKEQQIGQQLLKFIANYDLSNWIFTKQLIIDSDYDVIPHSHPILTLHTRHIKDDDLLLSTFVHEQLHWYLEARAKETAAAVNDLKTAFPQVPVGFPQGANNEQSSYEHLLVCYFEYQAAREFWGELRAKQVMEFWATDHYTWIYKTILEQGRKVGEIINKNGLKISRQNVVTQNQFNLKDLNWLAGCWLNIKGNQQRQENWTKPTAGMMMGIGIEINNDKVAEYEYMRIHQEPDGIYFTALPSGQSEASFKLIKIDNDNNSSSAIFENAAHDFPQRVIYRRNADRSLLVRIEGNIKGEFRAVDFPFQRAKCANSEE